MSVHVTSECGKLKKVLLHRPSFELNQLTPGRMEELLFADIPFLNEAQKEHDEYAALLRSCGAETVYAEDLMAETLRAVPDIREQFLNDFISEGGEIARENRASLLRYFLALRDENEIVAKAIAGVRYEECGEAGRHPLYEQIGGYARYLLDPLPNMYFVRDEMTVVGNRLCLNHMASENRNRETVFGRYILNYHPDYAGTQLCYKHTDLYRIEGGDIMNLSRRVIAVGLSGRTTPEAVELLARRLFSDPSSDVETILVLDVPHVRSFAHLDAVITQVDYDKFVVYPSILGGIHIYEITPGERPDSLEICELDSDLAVALATHMGLEKITLIHCGGRERTNIEREQWNFGSSVMCIKPGTVIAYDRNQLTNRTLENYGIEVLEFSSYELSRGNGGPHSMAVPLIREDL